MCTIDQFAVSSSAGFGVGGGGPKTILPIICALSVNDDDDLKRKK